MTEVPKRIWAESPMGLWNSGSWSRHEQPGRIKLFPDERPYVLADIADEHKRQRDLLLAAAMSARNLTGSMIESPYWQELDRLLAMPVAEALSAAIAECKDE